MNVGKRQDEFLRKKFCPLGRFDTPRKIRPHFFVRIPEYLAARHHLGNKAHGNATCSPWDAKNANDPSPFGAILDSISAADAATSARGPSRERANGERRTVAFVPRLPARIRLGFAETLIESSRRRVGDVHFVIIAPNESHFPASRRW